jgi:hypothetical protein
MIEETNTNTDIIETTPAITADEISPLQPKEELVKIKDKLAKNPRSRYIKKKYNCPVHFTPEMYAQYAACKYLGDTQEDCATYLNIRLSTLKKHLKTDIQLQQIDRNAQEHLKRMALNNLYKWVEEGSEKATFTVLRTKLGFNEKIEISGLSNEDRKKAMEEIMNGIRDVSKTIPEVRKTETDDEK